MSIKDLLGLSDDSLRSKFHEKAWDASKGREKHIKSLDLTSRQFGSPEPTRGRKSWKAANNVVEYQSPFPIDGRSTHYVPSERFGDFIEKLKNLITKGEFDTDIKKAHDETPGAVTRKARSTSGGGGGGREWTPERREAYAATIAARKAAKNK